MCTTPPPQASQASQEPRRFEVGERVVLRHRLAEPDELGHTVTDALGEIVAATSDALTIRTRRGDVAVAREAIETAKRVPPAPAPRGRRG